MLHKREDSKLELASFWTIILIDTKCLLEARREHCEIEDMLCDHLSSRLQNLPTGCEKWKKEKGQKVETDWHGIN